MLLAKSTLPLDSPVAISDLECPICSNELNRPIELVTCGQHVCADCCCEWLRTTNTLSCPCCYYGEHFSDTFSSIRPASSLVLKLMGGLQTVCRECNQVVKVADYRVHNCGTKSPSEVQAQVQDVLQKPRCSPYTYRQKTPGKPGKAVAGSQP